MSKEEILEKFELYFNPLQKTPICYYDKGDVEKAMSEYAKQRSIEFGDWLQFNYQPHAETGKWYDHHKKGNEGIEDIFTTEQLYQLFEIQPQK